MNNEWRNNLKVGDKVIIYYGMRHGKKAIAAVEKITKTQINCGNWRFMRSTGQEVGGDRYWSASMRPATEEAIQEIRRENRIAKIKKLIDKVDNLEYESLGTILNTLENA